MKTLDPTVTEIDVALMIAAAVDSAIRLGGFIGPGDVFHPLTAQGMKDAAEIRDLLVEHVEVAE